MAEELDDKEGAEIVLWEISLIKAAINCSTKLKAMYYTYIYGWTRSCLYICDRLWEKVHTTWAKIHVN